MTYALDSSALVAFLESEPGGDVVESLFLDAGNICFAQGLCPVRFIR